MITAEFTFAWEKSTIGFKWGVLVGLLVAAIVVGLFIYFSRKGE